MFHPAHCSSITTPPSSKLSAVSFIEFPDCASSLPPCALMPKPTSPPRPPGPSGLTLPSWLGWFHPTDRGSMSLPPEVFPLFPVQVRSYRLHGGVLFALSTFICVYVTVFIFIPQPHSSSSSTNPQYQFMHGTE